jgi:choline kinase
MQTSSKSHPIKAVILAAGVGSRISPLSNDCPKSLLQVVGIPILERIIVNAQNCGINEVVIVLGHLGKQIRSFVAKRFPTLKVSFIVNDKYAETGTAYSLWLTKNATKGKGFIKFDADIVFDIQILEQLISSNTENTFCIDRNFELAAEEAKTIMDKDLCILQEGKSSGSENEIVRSIGIEKISADTAEKLYENLSKMMAREENFQENYKTAYDNLIASGIAFHAIDISSLNWTEINTRDDFKAANIMFKKPAIINTRAKSHNHLLDSKSIKGFRRN